MKYSEEFIQGNHSHNRKIIPKGVVLHNTGNYSEKSIKAHFTNPKSKASAHVVIWKNGSRTVFAHNTQRAWHAGVSEFKGRKYCNNFMLGVEFHGDTNKEPLTFKQIESFIEWFISRKERYNIVKNMITDHRTIAPGRKVDLNPIELKRVLTAIDKLWL